MASKVLLVSGVVSVLGVLVLTVVVWMNVVAASNEKPPPDLQAVESTPESSAAPPEREPEAIKPGRPSTKDDAQERFKQGVRDSARRAPKPNPAPSPSPTPRQQDVTGAVPAADTTTLVSVPTCDGSTFELNVSEKRMFALHNQTRGKRGLKPLCVSPDLTKVARSRSQDMLDRDYFSHYPPDGTDITDHVRPLRYPGPGREYKVGENLAKGGDGLDQDIADHLFEGLMNSPGHKKNILRKVFSEVGVGARSGTYQQYDDVSTIYTLVYGGEFELGSE
jgi:uncharacterized protein YkwD